jgi:single-strand DNA-binding protein
MYEPLTTVIGNVVSDVSHSITQGGSAVANFRIACNPRTYSKERQQWVDGEPQFYQVTAWRQAADNALASLRKGQPVVVHGKVFIRRVSREVDGQTRVSQYADIEAIAFGPDVSRCQAVSSRVPKAGSVDETTQDREVSGRVA